MPDQINKQSLVNLLIDSPLREPIKINLIDIVNNTPEPDLDKIFPTIIKELEIFQKATDRRLKLAEEIIAKLGGIVPQNQAASAPSSTLPPLSPAPTMPVASPEPEVTPEPASVQPVPSPDLQAPTLDLPPMPSMPSTPAPAPEATPEPTTSPVPEPATPPTPTPLGESPSAPGGDEAALAEIQKELDSLKADVTTDAGTPSAEDVTSTPPPAPETTETPAPTV